MSGRAVPRTRRGWISGIGFALGGGALLAWLIVRSDPAALWASVSHSAGWVPVLVAIEGIRIAVEAWGSRRLYEGAGIEYPLLLRATLVAYAVAAVAPGGRASGEAVKAGMLRNRTRLADTAAAATTLQTASLAVLGAWSLFAAALAAPTSPPLAGALGLQAAVTSAGALFVGGAARTRALGRLVGRVSPRAREGLEKLRGRARAQHLREPLLAFGVSRGLELVQYAVLLHAIAHRCSPLAAVRAFGVATVAGTVGDSVPVQLGVLGAALSAADRVLGISREQALAVALLAHAHQIAWIIVGLLTPLLWRSDTREAAGGTHGARRFMRGD